MKILPGSPGVLPTRIPQSKADMSYIDHNFLGWILQQRKPNKILEVGVAAGGTSEFILRNTGPGQKVYGVDIDDFWWRDKAYKCGFKIYELCDESELARHTLLTGMDVIDRMEEIGGNIDFCLLDTCHTLPGELLQFFVILPYMKPGGTICLHDISLNFYPHASAPGIRSSCATRLLYSVVGSRTKMMPDDPFPNIGAFQVDRELMRRIDSTMFALGMSWDYYPDTTLLEKYHAFFVAKYGKWHAKFFESCIVNQKRFFE